MGVRKTRTPNLRKMKNWILTCRSTIASRFDAFIRSVENHEAIIEANLREARSSFAQARVRLDRVVRDGERIRRQLETLRESCRTWEERAFRLREENEADALECLKRRNEAAKAVLVLEAEAEGHHEQENRLREATDRLRSRIEEIERRRNSFAARAAQAKALNAIPGDLDVDDTEAVFERWEMSIAAQEPFASDLSSDSFADRFTREENECALRAELRSLRKPDAGKA